MFWRRVSIGKWWMPTKQYCWEGFNSVRFFLTTSCTEINNKYGDCKSKVSFEKSKNALLLVFSHLSHPTQNAHTASHLIINDIVCADVFLICLYLFLNLKYIVIIFQLRKFSLLKYSSPLANNYKTLNYLQSYLKMCLEISKTCKFWQ